jgi:hypothetical protein
VRALVVAVRLGDSGELGASGGSVDGTVAEADVAGIVHVGLLHGAAKSDGGASTAEASVAGARIGLLGVNIETGILQSNAKATCGDSSGSSVVADLRTNGAKVVVTGEPNQTIAVGPVRVVINEQTKAGGAIAVHAIHVSAANVADVALGSSRASVVCPCGTPSGSSSGGSTSSSSSGGSTSSSSSGGSTSSSSSGGSTSSSSSGGSTSSSSSGGEGTTPADFGGLGDACDDANTCSEGNRCAPAAAPKVN